jgi:hypothetical protein
MARVDASHVLGRLVRLVVLALMVGTADGCSRAAATGHSATMPDRGTARLTVRNHHWEDMRVYVVLNGRSGIRLGIAPAFGATTFTIPRVVYLPNELRFVAIPLGHEEPQMTGPIIVEAGAKLDFTIENAAFIRPSIPPQGLDRIHLRRPPRRDVAREQADRDHAG